MKPQVVLDTNILVAGLGSSLGASSEVLLLFADQAFDLHISVPVFFQYQDVLMRGRRKPKLSEADVALTLTAINRFGIPHEIPFLWRCVLTDPGDAAFLELAITARAEFIVTHNMRHFQGCEAFGIRAIKPIEFLEYLGETP